MSKLTALKTEGPAGHAEHSHMSVIYAVFALQSLLPSYTQTESSDINDGSQRQPRRSLEVVYEILPADVDKIHSLQLAAMLPHVGPRIVVGFVAKDGVVIELYNFLSHALCHASISTVKFQSATVDLRQSRSSSRHLIPSVWLRP